VAGNIVGALYHKLYTTRPNWFHNDVF